MTSTKSIARSRFASAAATMLAATLALNGPVEAWAQGEREEKLTVRFYPIQDLLSPAHGYRFQGRILPGVKSSSQPEGSGAPFVGGLGGRAVGMGGGGLGGGDGGFGGGGGGFGGGGAFNVGDHVAPQMGAGGMGGGMGGAQGMGGFGGGALPPMVTPAYSNIHGIEVDDLIDVLTQMVGPEQWDDLGGPHTLHLLGGQLVIRASASVHVETQEFLNQVRLTTKSRVPVTVEAYWFQVDRQQAVSFPQTAAALDALIKDGKPTGSARVRCLNGQTVAIASGTRQSVTDQVTPVVGGSATAYQPTTVYPNLGAVLEVRPLLLDAGQRVMVDVQSMVTRPTGSSQKRRHDTIELDDVAINAHQISTTIVSKAGEFFVAGGLTTKEPAGADSVETIYLVMRVNASK